jgi:tetratricopeptide (TPR) repeat protein
MRSIFRRTQGSALLLAFASLSLGGCASLLSSAASGLADNLSSAILNQDDPETVRAGAPSYMLLLDSFLEGDPDNRELLASAATLYASYGAVFADDPVRASRLTTRARNYAQEAMCESYAASCAWPDANYDEFVATLDGVTARQSEYLYAYGFATLAYLRAHSDDWNSLAELPQVEALFNRYLEIAGDEVDGTVHTYMGILLTLRPPSLGGRPEEAREHFEKAIALSDGRDLSAKVEYAKGYAKLLYERDLHDRLLGEVIDASPYADGLTLSNVMAREEAEQLLAEADDYF